MRDQYGRNSMRNSLHGYVGFRLVNFTIAFLLQFILVKTLSPQNYATYALLVAVVVTGERLLSFGIDRTTMRFLPVLTKFSDVIALRCLLKRILMLRFAAIISFLTLFWLGLPLLQSLLPLPLTSKAAAFFAIWFVANMLLIDGDAFAQAWFSHQDSSLINFAEVSSRSIVIIVILVVGPTAVFDDIIAVTAITMSAATIGLFSRLARFRYLFGSSCKNAPIIHRTVDQNFDVSNTFTVAWANYASTLIYLISSVPVIRLVASPSLDVVALAAFSFAQSIYLSAQRIFPGILVLPTLETIFISKTGDLEDDYLFNILSLVFKIDLILVIFAFLLTYCGGKDIINLLSRAEYSNYFYVVPILIASLIFPTAYRIFEIIANMSFRLKIFFRLWPIGMVSVASVYLTGPYWGIFAALIWPLIEICVRLAILAVVFRKNHIARTFDLACSLPLVLAAVVIAVVAETAVWSGFLTRDQFGLPLAVAALLIMALSLLVIRPMRFVELQILAGAMPRSLGFITAIARLASKTS
jgi:O-antigen/teichoic acid export membrane protein